MKINKCLIFFVSLAALPASEIKKVYNHITEQGNTLVINLAPSTDGTLNIFDIESLYAGARTLGIGRGNAGSQTRAGECAVEVRHVTDKGYIAFPTKYIYGKRDEDYRIKPEDLSADGYKLMIIPENTAGKFTDEKIVVEFIYEDTGIS
ncbi:MAG: MucBP domain-containing protein [Tannerella sp.]|jgi:hypothetical protein|nr:MucBP domain-containing protein [Tannerella sp.]